MTSLFSRLHNALMNPGSNKSMVSKGGLGSVTQVMDRFDKLDQIISEAVSEVERRATEELRSEANLHPFWKEHADTLHVKFDGDIFDYQTSSQEAMDLELGGPERDPSSLLRSQANSKGAQNKIMLSRLIEKGLQIG